MPSSRESSQPRDQAPVFCTADWLYTAEPPGKPILFIVVCLSQSQSPDLSPPAFYLQVNMFIFYIRNSISVW